MQEISSSCGDGIIENEGARGIVRRSNFFVSSALSNLFGRINRSICKYRSAPLASKHEVAIMYFGRTSEFLVMTSERMVIPTGRYTLGQLLCSLRKRGGRWADELDGSHLICKVNGRNARLFDAIEVGAEISFSSRKSIFEV